MDTDIRIRIKRIKTLITSILHMFKKRMRDMRDIKVTKSNFYRRNYNV